MSIFFKRAAILFSVVNLAIYINVAAQGNPINKVSIASPTAASLGKFGDIPINYYTGVPKIDIPIYTAKAGTLSLPITLSYHAAGLKVQEPAGWCGAGWALDAGGVITRSVMGAPDEKGTNNAGIETHGHFSQYGYNNYSFSNSIPDWNNFGNGFKDGEPDLFFFNFSGFSGKFYFRDDRTPVIVPEQDVRIVPLYNETGNESIQGFILTTPNGVQYSFGNTPGLVSTTIPIEKTFPVTETNGLSSANTVSSWFLNKVTTADGLFSIDLIYQPENYAYHSFSIFPIRPIPTEADQSKFGPVHGYELIKNIIQGVQLSQIKFPNGVVNFVGGSAARTDLSDNTPSLLVDAVNTSAKPLGSIEISDGVADLRKFNFTYSYFTDIVTALPADIQNFAPNLQTDRKRLRLDKMQEIAGDNSISKPPHVFTYFSEPVPRRMSFAFDHWGFINGVTANQSPIPAYTMITSSFTSNFTGADREAHWPAFRGGTLQQINYPTGGYSMFEFESNTSYKTVTNYVNGTILNLSVHLYGQDTTANSQTFVTDGSAMNISFNNSSNYSCTFSIKNVSTNAIVYTTNIANAPNPGVTPALSSAVLTLPQGTYAATLTLYSSSGVTYGTTAIITQISPVQVTSNVTIGGNRIKTITNNDGITSNNVITSYSYLADNGQSSSILFSSPIYTAIVRNDLFSKLGYYTISEGGQGYYKPFLFPNGCITGPDAAYYKSGGSIRPMATTQGGHIGYSQVKVAQTGNGYSVYKYYGATGVPSWQQNNGDVSVHVVNTAICDINSPNFPAAPLPFDPMRGELQYEAHYNQAGQVLKEATYTPVYATSTVTTPGFMVVSYGQQLLATTYELSTYHKTQSTTVETMYNPGGGSFTTTNVSYNESPYHHEVTRTSTTNSKNQTLETKNKYAFDFRISTCESIADGITQYNTDCNTCNANYNTALQTCNGGTAEQNAQCISSAYIARLQCQANARINYTAYQKTNFTNQPSNTFKTNHEAAKNGAGTELKPILDLQDNYGNAAIEISKWNTGNLLVSNFSRYDYSTTPSGKVYLNKVQSLNPASLSSSFTSAVTNGSNNSIIKDSRYIDEAIIKYYNGNIAEVVKKDGVPSSYIWGYNNVFPVVKVDGADFATLKTAYDAVGGNFIRLRSQASLSKALVSTYAYMPLVGITKETDPNNKDISYEYDILQRLKNIKDYQGNIVKNFQYNYANSCGNNCVVLPMQTFTSYNTPSYPVGVFNGSKQYIGIANNPAQYVNLWNSNAANQVIGVLSTNADSLHFNLSLSTNSVAPPVVFGLRYFQWDVFTSTRVQINTDSLSFIDWGDNSTQLVTLRRTSMTESIPYGNTNIRNDFMYYSIWIDHTYAISQPRTITVFHNETTECVGFSNYGVTDLQNANIRGYYPEKVKGIAYNLINNSSDLGVINFASLKEVVNSHYFFTTAEPISHNKWQSINNFHKMKWLKIDYKYGGEIASNFRTNFPDLVYFDIKKFKPDINQIWGSNNGGFPNLYVYVHYLLNETFSTTETDLILNSLAAANTISSGKLILYPNPVRTAASTTAYNILISRGWNLSQIDNP